MGTNADFVDWITDEAENPITENIKYEKGEKHKEFMELNSNCKIIGIKMFLKWVKKYSEFKGFVFEETKSNGKRYFILSKRQ